MTSPAAAFQGTIHSFKTIPSRSVVSITVEVPIEQLADIARIAEHGAWVAVARLQNGQEKPAKEKLSWSEVQPSAQCGIRCNEPRFRAFLADQHGFSTDTAEDAAVVVRQLLKVTSRTELSASHQARTLWHQLDSQYREWAHL